MSYRKVGRLWGEISTKTGRDERNGKALSPLGLKRQGERNLFKEPSESVICGGRARLWSCSLVMIQLLLEAVLRSGASCLSFCLPVSCLSLPLWQIHQNPEKYTQVTQALGDSLLGPETGSMGMKTGFMGEGANRITSTSLKT